MFVLKIGRSDIYTCWPQWIRDPLTCFSFSQDSWYEFRALAVMDDLVSESSNVVGVSSTGENKGRRSNAPIHCFSCLELHCPLLVLIFNTLMLSVAMFVE